MQKVLVDAGQINKPERGTADDEARYPVDKEGLNDAGVDRALVSTVQKVAQLDDYALVGAAAEDTGV